MLDKRVTTWVTLVSSDLASTVWHRKKTMKVYWSVTQHCAILRKKRITERKIESGKAKILLWNPIKTRNNPITRHQHQMTASANLPCCFRKPYLRQRRVQYWVYCIEHAKTTWNVFSYYVYCLQHGKKTQNGEHLIVRCIVNCSKKHLKYRVTFFHACLKTAQTNPYASMFTF